MSHEIEQMAYLGEKPWHGLGNELIANQSIGAWQQAAGLNWDALLSDVFFYANPEALRKAQGSKILYRSDTLEPLSIVSNRYRPVQPGELLEFYRSLISDFGFELETAGSLKGGRKVWALANTKQAHYVGNQDEVRGYFLLATSYDGTFATTAQFTAVRVVCNNTLQISLNSTLDAIKIGHNQEFKPDEVKAQFNLTADAFAVFKTAADTLARIKVDSEAAMRFYRSVMDVGDWQNTAPQIANKNLAERFAETFVSGKYIGSDLETSNGTAWGLVNVVTEYLDHVRRQTSVGGRLDSAWFGTGARIKQRTYQQALELA